MFTWGRWPKTTQQQLASLMISDNNCMDYLYVMLWRRCQMHKQSPACKLRIVLICIAIFHHHSAMLRRVCVFVWVLWVLIWIANNFVLIHIGISHHHYAMLVCVFFWLLWVFMCIASIFVMSQRICQNNLTPCHNECSCRFANGWRWLAIVKQCTVCRSGTLKRKLKNSLHNKRTAANATINEQCKANGIIVRLINKFKVMADGPHCQDTMQI